MDNKNFTDYDVVYADNYSAPMKTHPTGIVSFVFAMVIVGTSVIAGCGVGITVIPYIGWVLGPLIACVSFLNPILAIAGTILGIIGVSRKNCKKGLAIAGLIICALTVLSWVVMIILGIIAAVTGATIFGVGFFAMIMEYLSQMQQYQQYY